MDIIDQIEIPSFERKNANFRRNFAIAAGCVGLFYALEQYNGSVSRTWKSVRRGVTAAVAAWLEDHGGFPLFSLEEEHPVPSTSVLDLNGLCGPRISHDGVSAADAAFLTRNPNQDIAQQAFAGFDSSDEQGSSPLHAHLFASADTPSFFQSTKFFACLDVEEARELFRATRRISLAPHEVLFRSGDPSDSGIYIVLHGTLGVFLEDPTHNTPPIHANTLRSGESVGDLDVVDGAARTVSCMALESGCLMVNVPRELFMDFVRTHPRALMLYLQQGLARLWRVAHFVLADFLQLQLYRPPRPGSALAAETAAAAAAGTNVPRAFPRTLSNLFGHERGTQTDPGELEAMAKVAVPPTGWREGSVGVVGVALPHLESAPKPSFSQWAPDIEFGASGTMGLPTMGLAASAGGVAELSGALPCDMEQAMRAAALMTAMGTEEPMVQMPAASTAIGGDGAADPQSVGLASTPAAIGHVNVAQDGEKPSGDGDVGGSSKATGSDFEVGVELDLQAGRTQAVGSVPSTRRHSPYVSPRVTGTGMRSSISPSSSEPTFNELLASTAASARTRGAGGPTHGPYRQPSPPPGPEALAAAATTSVPSSDDGGSSGANAAGILNVPAQQATATASTPAAGVGTTDGGRTTGVGAAATMTAPASIADCSSGSNSTTGSAATILSTTSASASSMAPYPNIMQLLPPPHMLAPVSQAPLRPPAVPVGPSVRPRGVGGTLPPRYGASGGSWLDETDARSRPQGPVCRLLPWRSQSLRRSFVLGERACLAAGWDVIDVEELTFDDDMWATLSDPRSGVGSQLPLATGGMLQDVDWASGCFYLVLDGHLLAERPAGPSGGTEDGVRGPGPGPGGLPAGASVRGPVQESALISPGSMISCAAFLSSTAARCKVVALEPSRLLAFSWQTLEALVREDPNLLIRLLVAASAALGPVIRRFISLGLNRVWLESGDVAYKQGDFAECLYVVISGRLRLLHETQHPVTHARQLHLEEEVGRGEAVGAVWAITGGHHDTSALCVRDSELVRMSRSAFRVISADSPLALSKLFSNIARRLVAAWDSRVRSDRGASGSHAPASGPTAVAAAAGGAAAAGLQQLPNPSRLGLTPLKSAGQLASGVGVVRGPRTSGRRGEIVTIAILPAGVLPDSAAAATMASALAGSPTDVAAAAAALAAAEAASMGGGSRSGSTTGSARPGSYSGMMGGAAAGAGGAQWRCPPGLSKQAAALATLTAIKRLSGSLKDALSPFGPVLLLDATVLSLQFPTASERLDVLFYRSKVTSWMAAQEEEYRFILLEGDVGATPWSSVCVAQADCILLVAPEGATPPLSQPEEMLVFNAASPAFSRPKAKGFTRALSTASLLTPVPSMSQLPATPTTPSQGVNNNRSTVRLNTETSSSPSRGNYSGVGGGGQSYNQRYGMAQAVYGTSSAAMLRRVELVLLHRGDGDVPAGTSDWLAGRPNLSRHHHVRLRRPTDIQRLARWMAGKAVGIVLSGGGSRGLAHLGVLTALEDAGLPLDAVGGTSQGAFMAALYAQGLGRDALNHSVRHYAQQLGSVRHLLSDLTLPVLSLFSGGAFDNAVRRVFERGAQRLEDLWLPFFCVTTNLTRGEASVHTEGLLWKLVRASMTIVGLLPPVWEDGCLLVDGGYMNNMPVDVMRSMMGVDSVVVVDVEGRDDMGWRSLTPYDGGLSGWRLLWDRVCPFPRWRSSSSSRAPPRYAALLAKLTAMTHAANLKRVAMEHRIDLYLRPPGVGNAGLMDFHLTDRIIKDAYRYATSAITQWKSNHRVGPFGIEETAPAPLPAHMTAAAPLAASDAVTTLARQSSGSTVTAPIMGSAPGAGTPVPSPSIPGAGGVPGAAATPPVPSCMTQLQKKQQPPAAVLAAVTASVGGSVPPSSVPFVAPAVAAVKTAAPSVPRPIRGYGGGGRGGYPGTTAMAGGPPPPLAVRPTLNMPSTRPPYTSSPPSLPQQRSQTTDPERHTVAFVGVTDSSTTVNAGQAVGRSYDSHAGKTSMALPPSTTPSLSTNGVEGGGRGNEDEPPQPPPGIGPPPSSGLRPVMSRMTRSQTRHSLQDLHLEEKAEEVDSD